MKDPGSVDSPTMPSSTNLITVTRYHVRYVRSDGRNTPGRRRAVRVRRRADVHRAGVRARSASFTLVRVQAKLEAPLMALRGLGGAVAISTIAEVTFYGTDQAGREVSAVATISVNFADWADPKRIGGNGNGNGGGE